MRLAGKNVFVVLAASVVTLALHAWPLPQTPSVPASEAQDASDVHSASDLSTYRALIDGANAARAAGDHVSARAAVLEVVTYLVARPAAEQDAAWLALLDAAARAAWDADDMRTASVAWTKVLEIRSRTLPDEHPDLQAARQNLGCTLREQGDLAGARALEEKLVEVRTRTLPDDHPDLQSARQNLGITLYTQGDIAGARALFEKVLDARVRTLADDHPELLAARQSVAVTLSQLGDLTGARAQEEKVLEVRTRTLPDDHPDLQAARQNLATTLMRQGDISGTRALEEKVLEVRTRTLPNDHPDLQAARGNLANTLLVQGDVAGARALQEQVLEVRTRTLPDDHLELQLTRLGLAATLRVQGELVAARALQEKALEVYSRTLPDAHPKLQAARGNLANTLHEQGDVAAARALREKVLEVQSRTLPDGHVDLQGARTCLAVTLRTQGDVSGARVLQEKVLEVYSRTLPDDHPHLQTARGNLANTLREQGDVSGARALQEKVLEVRSRTLPEDHPDLQTARYNLAVTLRRLGDAAGARALQEQVLEILAHTLPEDHRDVQSARQALANTLCQQGDFASARALHEQVLEVFSRTLPDEHPELQLARLNLAATLAAALAIERGRRVGASDMESPRERCAELIGAICRAHVRASREAILGSSVREAEERFASQARSLDTVLSFAQGFGVFGSLSELESPAFIFAETTRGGALASAELARRAASSPRYGELRGALRAASEAIASLAQQGTTGEEFDRALAEREAVERELAALARELSGGKDSVLELDVASLAARLEADEAAVSFRRFKKARIEVEGEFDSTDGRTVRETSIESLCAFVVRSSMSAENDGADRTPSPIARVSLVDLGPIAPIEAAASALREGLGATSDGRGVSANERGVSASSVFQPSAELRERILDPVLPFLVGARRIVVVLDDVLHVIPLDALPLDAETLVGDRWQIETRTTLVELLLSREPALGVGELVALGEIDYDVRASADGGSTSTATSLAAAEIDAHSGDATPSTKEHAGMLRGGAWAHGFSALPGTGVEVRGIERCFEAQFGSDEEPMLCEGASATRERLFELASRARWLHIATHGWFAPESIRSWSDPEPLDELSGLGTRMSSEEQVKRMSPMLLCGLALAGANLPEDAVGRAPGLVTAEEISTLDLSNCELAVLSACDTNVGERRAGQGVASLQKALQMAGARSVITSLWKVPDEATKELMLDFYRRLWVEKKPKWQALWEAKRRLREAKDERGEPLYTTRDWAAWVLTGSPD